MLIVKVRSHDDFMCTVYESVDWKLNEKCGRSDGYWRFEEALQKALRMVNESNLGFDSHGHIASEEVSFSKMTLKKQI